MTGLKKYYSITQDFLMVEALIDSFMIFMQEQSSKYDDGENGCSSGYGCNS